MGEIGKTTRRAQVPSLRAPDAVTPEVESTGKALDVSQMGGDGPVSTERFRGAVEPAVAAAILNGALGGVKGLIRLVQTPPTAPKELGAKLVPRLEQLLKALTQVNTPEVRSALGSDALSELRGAAEAIAAAVSRLEAGGALSKIPRFPSPLLDEVKAACTAITATATTPAEALVLLNPNATSISTLFDTPLPPNGDVAALFEGTPPAATLRLIADWVRQREGTLTLEDVGTGARAQIWPQAGAPVTNEVSWAQACPELTLIAPLPTALQAEVERLTALGLTRLRFTVNTSEASALEALAPLLRRTDGPTVELVGEDGRILAKADPVAGPTLYPRDRLSADTHEAYRGLIRAWLNGGGGRTLHVPSNGDLSRLEDGHELRLKGGKAPLQKDLRLEQLAHSAWSVLTPGAPNSAVAVALRTILHQAQAYLEQPGGADHPSLHDSQTWVDAMDGIRRLSALPMWASLVSRVITDIATYSEHPTLAGFGNPALRGAALGANSVALLELLAGLGSTVAAGALRDAANLLGPQGKGVTVRGATLGILAQKELGPWARKASAADEQAALLHLIDEGLRATIDGHTEIAISAIPTDPGLGTARTVTPDFAVERRSDGEQKTVLLDAKSIDARYFTRQHLESVRTAVHQVLGHRLKLGRQSDGCPLLRLYNVPTDLGVVRELLETVQAGLRQGLEENPRSKTGNTARLSAIVVLDQGRERPTFLVRTGSIEPLEKPIFRGGLEGMS